MLHPQHHQLHYDLQGVSKYAREAAEFVNLYSKSRGINRFPALDRDARMAAEAARGASPRQSKSASRRAWSLGSKRETKLANPALEAEVEETGDPDLTLALDWSKAVNETIGRMVVRRSAVPVCARVPGRLPRPGRLLVVSATPNEALQREWEEHDLAKYVAAICGQEIGTKKEMLGDASQYRAPVTR